LWTGSAGYSETDIRQEFIQFHWKGNQQPETNGKLYPENALYWRLISGILFIDWVLQPINDIGHARVRLSKGRMAGKPPTSALSYNDSWKKKINMALFRMDRQPAWVQVGEYC